MEYWFNLKTKQVETGPQTIALERLGPFSTFEEASRAEEIIAEKARALREEDRASDAWEN